MATPPTLVAYYESAAGWYSTNNNVTGIAWNAGDIILCISANPDDSVSSTPQPPSCPNLTFGAAFASYTTAGNNCKAYAYKIEAPSSQTNQTFTSSSTQPSGVAVWVLRGVNGGVSGVTGAWTNSTAKGVSLVRGHDNSLVMFLGFDWGAETATQNWTPTAPANVRENSTNGNDWGVTVLDWGDQGSAGTSTYGQTGTGGSNWLKGVFEIEGVPGGGPVEVAAVVATTATLTSVMAWTATSAASLAVTATISAEGSVAGQLVWARPSADTVVTGWSDAGGGTSNLYTNIDETSASDADYVKATS